MIMKNKYYLVILIVLIINHLCLLTSVCVYVCVHVCVCLVSNFDECMNIPYDLCLIKFRQHPQISSFINVKDDSARLWQSYSFMN